MTEAQIEREVCRWARIHGISNIKLAGTHDKGKPDRLFMKGGEVCFIEFKRPGKTPTKLQMRFMLKLWDDQFDATWCDSVSSAKAHLRKAFLV